jgi:hypothetical protein
MTSLSPLSSTRSSRNLFWIVGVGLLVSYAYFYQAGGWNQNSRFALDRAILEHHTLQIDAYNENTGDIAVWNGHYYSDKAPGGSLLALAPVQVARWIARAVKVRPTSMPGIAWTSYVATVATSGLFTVLAALCVMWISLTWGFSPGAAVFAATAYGVASPAWCYATLFMGHGVAAGCLMLAFAAAIAMADGAQRRQTRLAWIIGLSSGCAVLTEFPAAVPVAFVMVLAWANLREASPQRAVRGLAWIVAGGAVMAFVLLGYNAVAFGSPLHIGYASERGFEELRTGFFGISYPQWWRVRELLLGSYRGLLPLAPLMALAPFGLVMLATTPARRRAAVTAAAVAVFYLLLNASYFYWEGGWAYGPRQVMPALPFVALGLAPLWDFGRRAVRVMLTVGWIWGAALTLIAVSTTPQPPASVMSPVTELLWPAFRDGDLSLNHQSFVTFRAQPELLRGHPELHAAWNLGEIAGLRGHASLLPLMALWIALGAALRRRAASRP